MKHRGWSANHGSRALNLMEQGVEMNFLPGDKEKAHICARVHATVTHNARQKKKKVAISQLLKALTITLNVNWHICQTHVIWPNVQHVLLFFAS